MPTLVLSSAVKQAGESPAVSPWCGVHNTHTPRNSNPRFGVFLLFYLSFKSSTKPTARSASPPQQRRPAANCMGMPRPITPILYYNSFLPVLVPCSDSAGEANAALPPVGRD